jgi:hypothetical protein
VFWLSAFCSLLLIYGLNTWLPQLMRQAGYPLGSALSFLLVFNAGAVVGLLLGGRAANRAACWSAPAPRCRGSSGRSSPSPSPVPF